MRSIPHAPRSPLTTTGVGRTVNWLLETRAANRPNHPFLVWEPFVDTGRTWTYAEFARDVAAVAEGLRLRGVGAGSLVLIHLDNCPEYVLTWFACARIGAVAVCTNTRSSQDEVSFFGSHSGASVVVTQPSLVSLVSNAIPGAKVVFVTDHNAGEPVAAADLPSRSERFAVLLDNEPGPAHQGGPLDPALVLYTSGTTGRPKAVMWTHSNTMWAAKVNGSHVGLGPADVTQVFLPLFHTNAQSYSILSTLWAGGTAVLQPRFSVSRFWDVARKHNCTFASQVNFSLRALANRDVPDRHSFTRWGTGMSGHPAEKTFNVPIVGWYGMTETVSTPIVGDLLVPNTAGTIGRAATQYEVAVLDADGDPVGIGETGDLRVRGVTGVSLFGGYLHDEDATGAAFDEQGWFITGDRITVHEDGSLSYADRGKDMLRVGGENVAASEIERVILSVTGVAEAAVVAGPDPMLDEVPIAFVVARPGAAGADLVEAVLAACRQNLADFKVPRGVRIVDDLPRATLDKVAKNELRTLLRSAAEAQPSGM
ncbi:AMP-binding protein [Streptomyces sp. NPDC005065]|uniref:AMP-binding protein n=1 Tax=Streptomyces sp. NPDC005065 TaxID=3154461 RepID=UPI0033AB8847